MKKFKVSEMLKVYLNRVLMRRNIPHRFRYENDGHLYCYLEMSGHKFHEIVLRAMCEKKTKEAKEEFVYITTKEYGNEDLLKEIGNPDPKKIACIGKISRGADPEEDEAIEL